IPPPPSTDVSRPKLLEANANSVVGPVTHSNRLIPFRSCFEDLASRIADDARVLEEQRRRLLDKDLVTKHSRHGPYLTRPDYPV
ncbi:MAG: hypothetical protein WB677_10565, partial [Xanthobacteraceae bacterium]